MSTPTAAAGGPAPKKYTKINGVMKLNPAYKAWKEAQSGGTVPATTSLNSSVALPVVSSMEDHAQLNDDLGMDVPLAESTNATIEMMQEPEICLQAGMVADNMVDKLGGIFAKYEVPLGLMNKLLMLSEFDSLNFIIDDSGSMQGTSDTLDWQPQTRWTEAHKRLLEMVEIVAYLPFNRIDIEFLNRSTKVVLAREGHEPTAFLAAARQQIDQAFASVGPSGGTLALEKLQQSIRAGKNRSVARYFLLLFRGRRP